MRLFNPLLLGFSLLSGYVLAEEGSASAQKVKHDYQVRTFAVWEYAGAQVEWWAERCRAYEEDCHQQPLLPQVSAQTSNGFQPWSEPGRLQGDLPEGACVERERCFGEAEDYRLERTGADRWRRP